jgi:hypothetical protein
MSRDRLEGQLRELLEEHSVLPPANPHRDTELRHRIGQRRRARIAGLVAVAAVVVAGTTAGIAALPLGRSASQVTASATRPAAGASPAPSQAPPSQPPPESLPEYSNGYHRITAQQIALPGQGTLTVTYTPKTLDFMLGFNCAKVPGQLLALTVNRHSVGTRECGPAGVPRGMTQPDFWLTGADLAAHYGSWADVGVAVGRPATFVVTVGRLIQGKNGQDPTAGTPSTAGDVFAGVYLPVPFHEYPFPPRPSTLADLDTQRMFSESSDIEHGLGLLDSRTLSSPNGSYSLTLTMPQFLNITFCAVAPGQVRFLVNGQRSDQTAFWDWDGSCYAGDAVASNAPEPPNLTLKNIHSGQKVTVTVVTTDFTVPGWRVGFEKSVQG